MNAHHATPFQSSGAIAKGKLYIERSADKDLTTALTQGQFSYVFAPQKIGKTSLQNRTIESLQAKGIQSARLDIRLFTGNESTKEEFYLGIVYDLANTLAVPDSDGGFWRYEKQGLTEHHRWSLFLREDLLPSLQKDTVIFIDNIEKILQLPVSMSEFFTSIKAISHFQKHNPPKHTLTFCILGNTTPGALTQDQSKSPFQTPFGKRIELKDFSREELSELGQGFSGISLDASKILDEIYNWTQGHPYLTQKTCEGAFQQAGRYDSEDQLVESTIGRLFLRAGRKHDTCLKVIYQHFVKEEHTDEYWEWFQLYRRLLDEEEILSQPEHPGHIKLGLWGLIIPREKEGKHLLTVRNRVMAEVFDEIWCREFHSAQMEKARKKPDPHTLEDPSNDELGEAGIPDKYSKKTSETYENELLTCGNCKSLFSKRLDKCPHCKQSDPFVGKVFGKYRLNKRLASGGMGHVYLVEHIETKMLRALKVIKPDVMNTPKLNKRFKREVLITHEISKSNHHIVFTYEDYGLEDGLGYYVMEYLKGDLLTERIEAGKGTLSIPWVLHITMQICDGMKTVHEAGIVHRDLKPDNIFLVQRNQQKDFVKIVDFGIAKVQEPGTVLTAFGTITGTPPYMSPEQIYGPTKEQYKKGINHLDGRSDIYALGCVLFELLTGRTPFEMEAPPSPMSMNRIFMQHIEDSPPSPRSLREDISEGLEKILMKMLAKKPKNRFQNMQALQDALQAELYAVSPSTLADFQTPEQVLSVKEKIDKSSSSESSKIPEKQHPPTIPTPRPELPAMLHPNRDELDKDSIEATFASKSSGVGRSILFLVIGVVLAGILLQLGTGSLLPQTAPDANMPPERRKTAPEPPKKPLFWKLSVQSKALQKHMERFTCTAKYKSEKSLLQNECRFSREKGKLFLYPGGQPKNNVHIRIQDRIKDENSYQACEFVLLKRLKSLRLTFVQEKISTYENDNYCLPKALQK